MHKIESALRSLARKGCRTTADVDMDGNIIVRWLHVPLSPDLGNGSWGKIDFLHGQRHIIATYESKKHMERHLEGVSRKASL